MVNRGTSPVFRIFKDKDDRCYYLEWAGKPAEQGRVPILGYGLIRKIRQ